MNKNKVTIATISWARNEEEENLLKKALLQLASLNIPVFITDGGSNLRFVKFLQSLPHFTLLTPTGKGLWAQAKQSLVEAYASDSSYIFYTEPDKFDFFNNSLPQMLDAIAIDEDSGIVTASRSGEAFGTFPKFQQLTETTINKCCQEVIGNNTDYTYGPFLLNKKIVPYLKDVQEDLGWGWRPYAFTIAKRLGFKVEALEGNFFCPLGQREDTAAERIYRMKQLSQNINGLTLAATAVL